MLTPRDPQFPGTYATQNVFLYISSNEATKWQRPHTNSLTGFDTLSCKRSGVKDNLALDSVIPNINAPNPFTTIPKLGMPRLHNKSR